MSLHYLVKGGCSKFLPNTWICYNQIAQIWCQSEDGILSQQLPCLDATARHAQVVPKRFFYVLTGRHPGAQARDTVTFLERQRCEKRVVV